MLSQDRPERLLGFQSIYWICTISCKIFSICICFHLEYVCSPDAM
jgi:hypothetical protein